jgi:hypothetical protein
VVGDFSCVWYGVVGNVRLGSFRILKKEVEKATAEAIRNLKQEQ